MNEKEEKKPKKKSKKKKYSKWNSKQLSIIDRTNRISDDDDRRNVEYLNNMTWSDTI